MFETIRLHEHGLSVHVGSDGKDKDDEDANDREHREYLDQRECGGGGFSHRSKSIGIATGCQWILRYADVFILSMILISGRKSAMTIVPTMNARMTIMIGSSSDVRLSTALSTSSS